MQKSITVLALHLGQARRRAEYHRNMMKMDTPVKPGGVLHQIQEMHRREAEDQEAAAADYQAALSLLQSAA